MAGKKKSGPETHHVVPNPTGGWDVKRGGAKRASGHFDTKREAIGAATRAPSCESTTVTAASGRATATGAIPTRRRAKTC
jgi:hypothetical protein